MKLARSVFIKTLRWIAIAGTCAVLVSHADEYADATQLVRANKFAEAMVKVEGYLASKPADPQMRFLKGVIQRNQNKQVEAINTFTKLTEDYPELPEPYNNLAVLYAGQGQYDKARVALEMAIRTNPSYATAHENIGDVYTRLASQAYNKALQLDSSNLAVPPKLALIREVFKPNLANTRPGAAASSAPVALTPVPAAPPAAPVAPAPVSKPTPAVSPAPTPAPTPAPAPAPAPVSSKPVATPGAPVAAPAKVEPMPAESDARKTVESAVTAWAQAWSAKDMTNYLSAYSADFDPPGKQSRSVWEQDRKDRITGKTHISVKLSELNVKVNGNEAVVKFRQAYKADSLSVSSRKTLVMQKTGNQWLISKESTGH
jgi:tetratricopeptide (TPR) repeat protein